MYRATLRLYDRLRGQMGLRVSVCLEDEAIRELLDKLDHSGGVTADLAAKDESGRAYRLRMIWNPGLAAFVSAIDGKPAGVIPRDELIGALGRDLPSNGVDCVVCLRGALDVWRRGCVDMETGAVHVFTRTPGLATLGATGFLTGRLPDGVDELEFRIEQGEPASGALMVPRRQLRLFRIHAAIQDAKADEYAERALEEVASIGQQIGVLASKMLF